MDHSKTPVLEALADYHRQGDLPFTQPGHKQGRGADSRVVEVLGESVFTSDVLTMNGLDDRRMDKNVLGKAHDELPPPAAIKLPSPGSLDLPNVMPSREAYFSPWEQVAWEDAAGRIGAELASPYPPGVPVIVPGERISREAVEYLRTGVDAGVFVPDPADTSLRTLRVVPGERS